MFLLVRRCVESLNWLQKLKIKVTLQGHVLYPSICVRSISSDPLGRFWLDFTQMFLSVSSCAEPMTWLCKLNVKVTLQCHVIYPLWCVQSTSRKLFDQFSLNFNQMFFSVMRCANQWLSYADSISRSPFNVMGFGIEFGVPSHLLNHLLDFH